MSEPHPALKLAREARKGPESQRVELAPPSELWRLSRGDGDMYRHAMVEAGFVLTHDGVPFNPCPDCGHYF